MKVLAVFLLALAVATSFPVVKTWTLNALSEAITNPKADPSMKPYLEDALDQIMYTLFTGKNRKFTEAVVPSPSGGSTWTEDELRAALADSAIKEEYIPALLQAAKYLELRAETGNPQENVPVLIPALDISTWTQSDLKEALSSPSTKTALMPYLEKAYIELKEALENGEERETVNMVTPVGLIAPNANYLPFEYYKRMKSFVKKTKKGL